MTANTAQRVDVERLSELLAKATPGPWTRDYNNDTGPDDDYYVEWQEAGPAQVHGKNQAADADLIAAMHEALPALLLQVAEQAAEIERLSEQTKLWERSFAGHVYVPDDEYAAIAEKARRTEAAERATEEACGLLRETVHTLTQAARLVGVEPSPESPAGRGAAFLAANGKGGA